MKQFMTITTLILAAASVAFGAGAEHGGEHGAIHIPTKLITYQAINVIIMFAALIYFTRAGVRKFFEEKRATYLSAAQKAESARRAAEEEHNQIQVRLSKLENTADESVSRARAEAADMKKQLIAEAEALSKRIREEAEQSARMEIQRAKNQLREALIRDSVEAAKGQLGTKVSAEDQKRLQSDFISNIQAVQK